MNYQIEIKNKNGTFSKLPNKEQKIVFLCKNEGYNDGHFGYYVPNEHKLIIEESDYFFDEENRGIYYMDDVVAYLVLPCKYHYVKEIFNAIDSQKFKEQEEEEERFYYKH